MSFSLIRPGINRALCYTCRHTRYTRFYASLSVLEAPNVDPTSESKPTRKTRKPSNPDKDGIKPKRTRKKAVAVDVEEDVEAPRSLLEDTKVEAYLAAIRAGRNEVTLADIERIKPRRHADPGSRQYADDYNALVDTLCRSFNNKQLRKFGHLYGLEMPSKATKWDHAMVIIEKQWNWPSLSEIQQNQRDRSEICEKSFPLSPSELFIILGRDGADLLGLSQRFDVHISLTQDPLALEVEGVRLSLNGLTEEIDRLKTGITEETFRLPTGSPIRADLIQRISRAADAFIENVDTAGQVRAYARDARDLVKAKRLAVRAACQIQTPPPPKLSYMPADVLTASPIPTSMFPHTYSLYPFLSPGSLPWTMNPTGAFRIRRVGEWLGVGPYENVQKTGGLAQGRGRILNTSNEPEDIKNSLLRQLPGYGSPEFLPAVKASLGHLLLTTSGSQLPSIVPPLGGHWVYSKYQAWMEKNSSWPTFAPSPPTSLLDGRTSERQILHRLVYRAYSEAPTTETIKFEMVLSSLDSSPQEWDRSAPPVETRCWAGSQVELDLLMPDRPMDLQFSAFDAKTVDFDELPPVLQEYSTDLIAFLSSAGENLSQPYSPLTLTYKDETYVLHSSSSVRQSSVSISPGTDVLGQPLPHVKALHENTLDLESNLNSTICEVICHNTSSDDGWTEFFSTCDHLTESKPAVGMKLVLDID